MQQRREEEAAHAVGLPRLEAAGPLQPATRELVQQLDDVEAADEEQDHPQGGSCG